jgi:hypothetical protein
MLANVILLHQNHQKIEKYICLDLADIKEINLCLLTVWVWLVAEYINLIKLKTMSKKSEAFIDKYVVGKDDWLLKHKEVIAKLLDEYETEQLTIPVVSGSLPSKDEVVNVGFRKATNADYNFRKVCRDLDHDLYYSGWMDCYDWLLGNDR